MHRFETVLLVAGIACLAGCRVSPTATGPADSAGADAGADGSRIDDASIAIEIENLQLRVRRLRAQLADPDRVKARLIVAVQPPDGPKVLEREASLLRLAKGAPLATSLEIPADETRELELAAAALASLEPRQARTVVLENWRTVIGQARMIKVLAHMARRSADRILTELPIRLVVFGSTPDYVQVYSAAHPSANAKGYVLVRLVRTRR